MIGSSFVDNLVRGDKRLIFPWVVEAMFGPGVAARRVMPRTGVVRSAVSESRRNSVLVGFWRRGVNSECLEVAFAILDGVRIRVTASRMVL